ncbi:hypothetical protein DXD26_06915 [Blautia sp. TF12-31AT]|nr:hypothetical protein DXD26_06915 [Blautia sp. TF12-31AT]
MLEDVAVVSLDASAVPLEDAVAPPLELVLVLPLSPHPASIVPAIVTVINSARTFMLRFFILFTSLRFSFLLDEFIIHKGCQKNSVYFLFLVFFFCFVLVKSLILLFLIPFVLLIFHISIFATSALFRHYDYLCHFSVFSDIFPFAFSISLCYDEYRINFRRFFLL